MLPSYLDNHRLASFLLASKFALALQSVLGWWKINPTAIGLGEKDLFGNFLNDNGTM